MKKLFASIIAIAFCATMALAEQKPADKKPAPADKKAEKKAEKADKKDEKKDAKKDEKKPAGK
jgi:Ni/Co efflux regulator RcnB